MSRDYKKEYETYHKSPKQKRRRAQRNSARAKLEKEGAVKKGDGKSVDHKDHNTANSSRSNLQVLSRSANARKNLGRGGRKPLSKKK